MQTFKHGFYCAKHPANMVSAMGCEPLSLSTWYQESGCTISAGLRLALPSTLALQHKALAPAAISSLICWRICRKSGAEKQTSGLKLSCL